MKTTLNVHFAVCLAVILAALLALNAAVFLDRSFELKPYSGPYPEELPAGYCLLTNGHKLTFSYPVMRSKTKLMYVYFGTRKNKGDVVYTAWDWIEYQRERRHFPELEKEEKEEKENFRPVNPELCNSPAFEI